MISEINTKLNKLVEKKKMVVPINGSLLVEMKMLVQNIRSSLDNSFLIRNSHEMKPAHLTLIRCLALFEGFIELLECAYQKPFLLIRVFFDGFLIYCNSKKTGMVMNAAGHIGKAAMAIINLIILILSPTAGFM